MSRISVNISEDLHQKITKIAKRNHCSVEDCISLALDDYADNFEDFYKTDLCSVDKMERSFFLSVGE